jgi:hypothetical protein
MTIPSTRSGDETHAVSEPLHSRSTLLSRAWIFPLLPIGTTVLLWGVIFTVLPPGRQEFPLVDDWAYAKGAFAFARGEGIHYYHQPSMPLLGQWLLAYPLIKITGESHAALRLLTVTLSIIGTLAFYDLLRREVRLSRAGASFTAAALALNPIVFIMSGTFMSDTPAFSLSLIALALYSRALREGSLAMLASAAAVATLATITRQNAVVTPLVSGILLCRNRALRWQQAWHAGVWLPLVIGVAVNAWFAARPDAVALHPVIHPVMTIVLRLIKISLYIGLTVLPLLALCPGATSGNRFFVALVIVADASIFIFIILYQFMNYYFIGLFPYLTCMITRWGTLEDDFYVAGTRPLMMGRGVQALLTVLACIGWAALADRATARIRDGFLANPLFLFTVLHVLILLISPTLFDRYLIVLIPGALALAAEPPIRARWPLGLGVLALFAVCSAGLTHDLLAWNSARWEVGRRALARGISVDDIEGGFEWDSWYSRTPVVATFSDKLPTTVRGLMLPFNHGRHPHITGRYALAFSQIPGTVVLDSQPYRLWLIPGEWRFLLLEQRDDDTESTE